MAQSTNDPLLDDLQSDTVLRSGRTLPRAAASTTLASATELITAPVQASTLSATVNTAQVSDSTAVDMETTSAPRDAVHAPLGFASRTAPQATSASTPEFITPTSNVVSSDPAVFTQAIAAMTRYFEDANISVVAALARTALPPPSLTEIPEFRGFPDNPTLWLQNINSLASRHSWPDDVKMSIAESRLRDSAKAWHRYDGWNHQTWAEWSAALVLAFSPLSSTYDDQFMRMRSRRQAPTEDVTNYVYDKLRLLNDCGLTWPSPAARQYVIDGLCDSTHAAILSSQSPEITSLVFAHKAAELQQCTRRRLTFGVPQAGQSAPLSSRRGCFSCERLGHHAKEFRQSPQSLIQYQAYPTPLLPVHVEGIGDLSALIDTGAERTALHQRHAPDNISPWAQPPIHGLGGSVMPVGMLDVYVRTTAGTKFLPAIPVFEDLPTDMILGSDFLLSDDIQLTIDRGHVELRPALTETTAMPLPTPRGEPLRSLTLNSILARHEAVFADTTADLPGTKMFLQNTDREPFSDMHTIEKIR